MDMKDKEKFLKEISKVPDTTLIFDIETIVQKMLLIDNSQWLKDISLSSKNEDVLKFRFMLDEVKKRLSK